MIKVLFVCLGNICRSPIAEATFRKIIEEKGLNNTIECDSAGTAGYHIGSLPDKRTIKNALSHGIGLTHRGRKISLDDFDEFQHIVVMDEANFRDVYELYFKTKHFPPAADKLFLLRDHDPDTRGISEVPDPYYEQDSAFEEVFQIVSRSNRAFVDFLIEKYQLKPKQE